MNVISDNRFTKYRRAGLKVSVVFVLLALLGVFTKGLNLGIDFTGGFLTEFSTSQSVEKTRIQSLLNKHINGKYLLSTADNSTHWIVRQSDDSDSTSLQWLEEIELELRLQNPELVTTLLDSDFIDTQIGKELIEQGGLAMLTAVIMILMYLSAQFEWRFASGAILALVHDIIFVLGVFAWTGVEFNLTVLASLLAIIGYSLNDSIIVADRVRELMRMNKPDRKNKLITLNEVTNNAIKSTLTRTLITSGTTLSTISAVWLLAGPPLQGFSIALFSGVLIGTLSSICISATFPELTGLDVDYYHVDKDEDGELSYP